MARATLTITSKNYGSWSLRGWFLCKLAGLDFDEVQQDADAARPVLPDLADDVLRAAQALRAGTKTVLAQPLNDRFAGAVAYLRAFARVLGAQAHLKAALADPARLPLSRVMIRRILPEHAGLLAQVVEGAEGLYAVSATDIAAE